MNASIGLLLYLLILPVGSSSPVALYCWLSNGFLRKLELLMCGNKVLGIAFLLVCFPAEAAEAQEQPEIPQSDLITKSVKAIGYTVRGGSTKVDFHGTDLMPQATGEAKVEAKTG